MIVIMRPGTAADGEAVREVVRRAAQFEGLRTSVHAIAGATRNLVEVYLLGATASIPTDEFSAIEGVERVIRISERYRVIGRHEGRAEPVGFTYRGQHFDQDSFHVFAGLCAIDNREHVDETFRALTEHGLRTARMGAYKPRTSPYDFQGHGAACLPYTFELAGKHGIAVIAMEITREKHIEEIRAALADAGEPVGVMLQVGTRNAQNFELLKVIGQQSDFPVLFKRGMGITLEESLNACEYVASEGNRNIAFCLRGVKSHLGDPHRNLVDFAHVPVVRSLTRMPVCVDPSHSVGRRMVGPDGLQEIHHATAQGVIAGANMVLVDFHPHPQVALCDGPQALTIDEMRPFLEDVRIVREAYEKRRALASAPGSD